MKLLKMSIFAFFHNVFYAICILKSFDSHISLDVCIFFKFWTVSKWCIGEWVNDEFIKSISSKKPTQPWGKLVFGMQESKL